MYKRVIIGLGFLFGLAACNAAQSPSNPMPEMGRGMGSGMMARHMAGVSSEYAGMSNPVAADEQSLQRGAEIYAANCASCHGDGGMGDGPAGEALDPPPAPLAHTSQMLGDDYLFWRITEGGAFSPFNSAMPSWKSVLSETERWEVILYTRALGSGQVEPEPRLGGERYDPDREAVQRGEILAQAVEQKVITQDEADLFLRVHMAIEEVQQSNLSAQASGGMADIEETVLDELVASGKITAEEKAQFIDVRGRMLDSGLMQ